MQKSLELMNVKIHTVISDLMGKTGTAIVEAIINGERKAEHFLHLVDGRIKADRETIIKSLEGNWRNEHLFLLKQSYNMYQFIQNQLCLCEQEVEKVLQLMAAEKQEGVIENIAPKSIHSTNPLKKRLKTSRYLIPGSI
jgi:hypothetical protein